MPAPDSVGANEKWRIVIEVPGEVSREGTAKFNKAIQDAIQAAQAAGTRAAITFNRTEPKGASGGSPGTR